MLSSRNLLLAGAMGVFAAFGPLTPAVASSCDGNCGTLGVDGDVPAPPGATTYGYVSTYKGAFLAALSA